MSENLSDSLKTLVSGDHFFLEKEEFHFLCSHSSSRVSEASPCQQRKNIRVSTLRRGNLQTTMGKRRRVGRTRLSLSDNDTEFFKAYFPHRSSHRLQIPPAFVKNFEENIPQNAILKDTVGRSWHVDLEEDDKGMFMKNGWEVFVSDNSLELGDFLVFRYNNDSSFTVRIFGKNGCKRQQQDLGSVRVKLEEEEETQEPVFLRKREYSKQGFGRPKRSKVCGEENQLKSPRTASHIVDKKRITKHAGSVATKRPYFYAVLTPSKPNYLNIPKRVLKEHKIKLEPEMVLRNPSGKNWAVSIRFVKDGRILISKGWSKFCNENNLRIDDTCVLEFVKGRGGVTKEIRACNMIRSKSNNRGHHLQDY